MIRDRIIVGFCNSRLSEKLQLKADLTLEKAVTSARQQESAKKQQKVVRVEESLLSVDVVHLKQMRVKTDKSVLSNKQAHKQNPVTGSDICTRCRKRSHRGNQQCPARDAQCRRCHRRGHFQAMCQTKSVSDAPIISQISDISLIGTKIKLLLSVKI